ncbi:class I SAM-dependent methyltransferase [Halobacteria archaeon AArc-m2/3/4]|uniref:Class I SAM-dependent methyltransferase n=1 Tax=Natronoglomus mannanivorans TaxID=2979990 RepID=A0ABT2QDY4_9EURY|nr:class I SAM-dependent methyltransferase [Halobacteria archaeon AArc-m2/3/4]
MDQSTDGYRAPFAEFYDQQVASSEREDVDFYTTLARETAGPVLELACGTGRVYLELLRAGVDADGLDVSEDALAVLRENATEADADLVPSVRRADMADFAVDREYELVICPFNAVQHLRPLEKQQSALECIHDALAPGGQFVFDVFVPSFDVICETYGEWTERAVEYRDEPHVFRTRTSVIDEVEQQFTVENELRDSDGALVFSESQRLTMLPKREVQLLARSSSFADWRVTGDFGGEPLADGDSIQVWTLEKGS